MDDAGTLVFADKISGENLTNRAIYAKIRLAGKAPARDFVFYNFVGFAREGFFDLGLGENESFVPYFDFGIIDIGADREHTVGHKGPGGGGPG